MNPVVHFEMPAKDNKRAAKFYTEVFGWQMNQLGQEMGNYLLANTTETDEKTQRPKNSGAINGGFYGYDPKKPGFQYPHLVISVDNLEESMELVKKAGGKIVDKPMDISGIGMYVSFEDSEGNLVGMLQPSGM